MHVEHSILVDAPAARIFRLYEAVSDWHTWDPDTKRASLDGPVAVGTRGSLTPTQGNTVPMVITELEPNERFTVESKIPLFRMVFEHRLVPQGDAILVRHRVTFYGPLSLVLGPLLRQRLHRGLPVTLANLKRVAEGAMAPPAASAG